MIDGFMGLKISRSERIYGVYVKFETPTVVQYDSIDFALLARAGHVNFVAFIDNNEKNIRT